LAIKPTKLRAVFLLLLFILLFICSNSLVIEVKADSLEESFKNTPLPFWDIETENTLIEYGSNTQEILFSYGEWLEDFNDVSDWTFSNFEGEDYFINENGVLDFFSEYDAGNVEDIVYTNEISFSNPNVLYFEMRYKLDVANALNLYVHMYEQDDLSGNFGYKQFFETTTWLTVSWYMYDEFTSWDISTIESMKIRSRADVGTSFHLYIEYIHIWKFYQEDFTDVSDWTYDSSVGLAGGEYGFGTDGNIGEIWIIAGGSEDEWVRWNTPVSYLITSKTNIEVRGKVETSLVICAIRLVGDGLEDFPMSFWTTSFDTKNADITDHAGKTIDTVGIQLNDNPDNGAIGNYSGYIDYINIWETDGTFNVSIPVEQFKNHKLEFMIDTDDLENTTKLEFGIFQNDESMNYDFQLQDNMLTQREFTFDYTEYNYLRFKLDLKYSTNYFKLSGYDENNSKLFSNIIYEYVRKIGNNFQILSNNITGWFHLYYFTGTVDYSTIWTETIVDLDPRIDYSMLSFSSWGDTDLDDHEVIYNRYVSNFQFFRTNIYLYTDFSISITPELGTIIDIQFYHPDGSEFYSVNGKLFRTENTFRFELEIYDGISLIHSSAIQGLGAQEIFSTFQFAIWRTQDNKVGAFYTYDNAVFTSEPDGIPRYVTNYTLENFQANVTITHFSKDIGVGYRNFESTLEGFELGYSGIDGVAEPHFSSTWWDSIPIIGPMINAIMAIGTAIIIAIEIGLSPITILLDSIFGLIGGVANSVWILFEGALSNLGISIDALASDVFGFFDALLTGISDTVNDVYTSIVSISDNLVAWVSEGITDVLVPLLIDGMEDMIAAIFTLWEYQLNLIGTALGWGDVGTFLFDFTDTVVLAVPSWLAFLISTITLMVGILNFATAMYDEYGATFIMYAGLFIVLDILGAIMTLDLDKIGACLGKYIKVIIWVAEFLLGIISMVLSAIWGILPF